MTTRRILVLPRRIALVAALVAVFVGASSSAAWALWSASASTGSSVTMGKLSDSIAGTSALTTTFSPTVTSVTAPVTFANTGSLPGTYSTVTSVIAGSSTALAAAVSVVAWPVAGTSACTASTAVGSGSVTGTWNSLPSLSGSLAAGSSAVWCIRSTPTASAPASATTNPNIALTVVDGSWTSGVVNGAFSLTTPAATASTPTFLCTDYSGNWHLRVSWDASTRPLATYYGVFVNGTMIGPSQQGYTGQSDLSASQVSTSVAPDGVARVNVTVLDSSMNPTTTIAATGTVTLFESQGSRAVKCGG